jgi:hypothetical protein
MMRLPNNVNNDAIRDGINVDCRLVPLLCSGREVLYSLFRANLQRIIEIDKMIKRVSSDGSGILEASVKDESNQESAQSIALLSTGLVQTPIKMQRSFSYPGIPNKANPERKVQGNIFRKHRHLGTSNPALRATANNEKYYNELLWYGPSRLWKLKRFRPFPDSFLETPDLWVTVEENDRT